MTKKAFLRALRKSLKELPPEDKNKSIEYYGEMIDDRIEEGVAEEEAVAALGTVEKICAEIAGVPVQSSSAAEGKRGNGWKRAGRIVLTVLCIFGAFFAIILAASILLGLGGGGLISLVVGVIFLFAGEGLAGVATLAEGFVAIGLAIFAFYAFNRIEKICLKIFKKKGE